MAGDDERRHLEHPLPPDVETVGVRGQRIIEGSRLVPPEVGGGDGLRAVTNDGRDVLGGVPRRLPESDALGDLESFSRSRRPDVVLVDRPVVMNPRIAKQGRC